MDAVSSQRIAGNEGNQAQQPKHVSINHTNCVYQRGALSQVWYAKMDRGNIKIISSTGGHVTSTIHRILTHFVSLEARQLEALKIVKLSVLSLYKYAYLA